MLAQCKLSSVEQPRLYLRSKVMCDVILVPRRRLVLLLVTVSMLGFASSAVVGSGGCASHNDPSLCNSIITTLHVAEENVAYIQKMTRAYLEVADNMHAAENTAEMLKDIKVIETNLADLLNGNSGRHIPKPPTQGFEVDVQKIQAHFAPYKKVLKATVASVNRDSTADLAQVEHQSLVLGDDMDAYLSKWMGYARLMDVPMPPEKEGFTRWQLVYIQRLVKEAMFADLGVKKSEYVLAQAATENEFDRTLEVLIEGSVISETPKEKTVCSLHEFYEVKHYWEVLERELTKFRRHQPSEIDAPLVSLEGALLELIHILENKVTDCPVSISKIDDEAWFNMVENVYKTRIYAQSSVRTYLELSKGMSNTEHLDYYLSHATHAMHTCVVGDVELNTPTAPEQEILDALINAEQEWVSLRKAIQLNVQTNDYSTTAIKVVTGMAKHLSEEMAEVAHQLVLSCKRAQPSLPSSVWELTERQLEFVQEMSNEALLVNLNVDAAAHKSKLAHTFQAFEDSHWKLLLGPLDPRLRLGHRRLANVDGSDALLSDDTVPMTTDACLLKTMRTVITEFSKYKAILEQVSGNNTEMAETAVQSMEATLAVVTVPLTAALQLYHHPGACAATKLSSQGWETSLNVLGTVPYLFQEALTEFSLMSLTTVDDGHVEPKSYSDIWLENSADVLAQQQVFITQNVNEDPDLRLALAAFRAAWLTFRGTDEERLLGLQIAYITLNPHPAGQKEKLDYAPGSEDYHAVHKQYHAKYRTILEERAYYDIFILDLEGNCIYSVYKELDFATNFKADGLGEWKDSGLGEAFVASIKDPNAVSIIDWKPYGPSAGALASFLSMGVKDEIGTLIGVYCTQMPPDSIPRDSSARLHAAFQEIDDILWDFRFGKVSLDRPPPPTQLVADSVFHTVDLWNLARPVLEGDSSGEALSNLVSKVVGVDFSGELVDAYYNVVKAADSTFPSLHIALASAQLGLTQKMCTQAIWIVHESIGSTAELAQAMENFTRVQGELKSLESNADTALLGRRLASSSADTMLDAVQTNWNALEPLMQSVRDTSSFGMSCATCVTPSSHMNNFITKATELSDAVKVSFEYFASTTRTTTLEPVFILAPMPLTGEWAGGATMRVSALLAEKMINDQQIILPGYDLHHKILDDKCDGRESSKIVLEEMNKDDTYVALGGTGCSEACAQATFVASTLKLPFLGYECPATKLSDPLAYPGLTRLGTVTISDPMFSAVKAIGDNFSWQHIIIVSSDAAEARAEAEQIETGLKDQGFSTEYILGLANDFDKLKDVFAQIKESTRGKQRNVFVVGAETFYRKLLCAAVVTGNKEGITWISHGTWRNEWWNMSDMSSSFQIAWAQQEAGSARIKDAFQQLNAGWEAFAASDDARRIALQAIYMTDEKNEKYSVEGDELYHVAHTAWHPAYDLLLFERQYYDIFFFDLRGNLIYSVYKETDYATNFAGDGTGEWKDSGLGDAFTEALTAPDDVHYIDWKPYGPSGYADAAFFSTGIRNGTGHLVGVYTIQLPPSYEQSIDKLVEECPLNVLRESFEGAINIAGLGHPLEEDMEKPLDCFKGHSAKSFYFELDGYLRDGFPGVQHSAVPDPYNLIRGNAADATCVVAYTLKHYLSKGYPLENLQHPTQAMYDDVQNYIKQDAWTLAEKKRGHLSDAELHADNKDGAMPPFRGATGSVWFNGNDKPNNLVIQQVLDGRYQEVGVIENEVRDDALVTGNLTWINGGVTDASWQLEDIDPPPPKSEEFNVFVEIILPFFFVIIPILLLLALSPLLCLVVLFIAKSCAGRVGSEGSGGA
jgi:hypothetical protein